ncbi:MAG: hypothetical protein ACTSSP_07205 [Candidatus Asgardarchaeia archaeon]
MEPAEYNIDFTDVTFNETDGVFKDIDDLMKGEFPYDGEWVLRSYLTIGGPTGIGTMEVQCHADGNVFILSYEPSIGDLFYNPDIQVLSMWLQENGWNIPQPHPDLVRNNKEFWKHFYDTLVVDSDYLDTVYGTRPQLEGKNAKKK